MKNIVRAKIDLAMWLTDRRGIHISVEETLWHLVRYRGYTLAVARAALIETIRDNREHITLYSTNDSLLYTLNQNGKRGEQRIAEWSVITNFGANHTGLSVSRPLLVTVR